MNIGLIVMVVTAIVIVGCLMYIAAKKKVTNKNRGGRAKSY
jgi:hypothetical protein